MFPLLAALWLQCASAAPDPAPLPAPAPAVGPPPADPCRSPPPDPTAPFAVELERARTLYRRGCHVWALDLFQALDGRRRVEAVDPVASIDARLYLGEVLFVLGRRDEAKAIFEAILSEHPNTRMSLLEHDPEVIDLFEVVRAGLARPPDSGPNPPPTFDIPPRPRLWLLPLGVPQLLARDTRGWTAQVAGQGGCGTLALTTYALHRSWFGTGPIRTEERPASATLKALNYASHACFIAFYVGSQTRATRTWRERHTPKVTVGPFGLAGEF